MDNGVGCGAGCGQGIEIVRGGVVKSTNNTIVNNNRSGLCLGKHGTFWGNFDTISAHPTNEGAIAVEVSRNSYAEIRDADVTGVVQLFRQSGIRFQDTELDGDVNAFSMSLIAIGSDVTGTYSTNCDATSLCPP